MTTTPSITCPVCKMTSYNPNDVREGYCGNCHARTATDSRPPLPPPNPYLAVRPDDTPPTEERLAEWEDQKRKGNTAWLELNPEPPALD